MHRWGIRAFVAAGAIGVTAGAGALLGAGSASAGSSDTVLHYTATYVTGSSTDVKPAGDSIGDTVADLFSIRTTAGKPAGDLTNLCTLFRPGAHPLAQCQGTVSLGDGVLTLAGTTTGSAATTYAITGGTGRYVGAGGVFRVDGGGHVTITLTGAR